MDYTNQRRLRLLSVVIPLLALAVLYGLRLLLIRLWPAPVVDIVLALVILAGVIVFSSAVFGVIERQEGYLARQHEELARRYATERRLRGQLEALHQASLAIASARTSEHILQRLVDLSRDLIGARYAALGVLGAHGAIDTFYTSGITTEERERLGAPPQGHGLLGVILTERASLRIPDISRDPRSVGFPPGHPPMRSLLGVPVAHAERVVGNLYLADKVEQPEFSEEDERLLRLLAGHAAVVIENARLAEQVRTLAIVAERDRIGKDLHDGVIQAIYAVTLELESAAEDVEADPHGVSAQLDAAISQLGEVIKDIRRYILGLQPERADEKPLPEALAMILAEARAHTVLETELEVSGDDLAALAPARARELLWIAREAVANVVRHAHAGQVRVTLRAEGNDVDLSIVDNGVGFDANALAPSGHYGLRNLSERAAQLGGTLAVRSRPGQGTRIELRAPLTTPEREELHV